MRFFDFLFPPRVDEIMTRDISIDQFLGHLAPRLIPDTRPGTVALLSFGEKSVRAAIHEAKYHGSAHSFRLLGSALAEYLRDADDIRGARPDLITLIPVPLGKERYIERSFNQTEEIAKIASKEIGIQIDPTLLLRTRETVSQVSLPRQKREENMRGAFLVARRADPSHTYVLIDDVITTGATLQAATDALIEGGAEHVIPLALAH